MREVADTHRELYAENADLYGASVASKIERCLEVGDSEYQAGLQARDRYRAAFDERLGSANLVVTPTLPHVAPPFGDEREQRGWLTLLTWPFNVLGAPAVAIPCGPAEDGLPASVQIAGRPGDDALVLAAAAALDVLLKS
jgi:aspartyl-tRNA(Asn)/glutamyl-tRNA(Gln) amidotransferase subunit A